MHDIVERVRALIAKAESSPFPAEADAFMGKAQQLIHQHAIDQALLTGGDPATVGHEEVPLSGSYTRERSMIWSVVAGANRCTVLLQCFRGSNRVDSMTLVGRGADRELVRLLAVSLESQAVQRMRGLDLTVSLETPVVQRRSFLRGFASEVAQRLERAKRQQQAEQVSTRSVSAALEIAAGAVERYVESTFGPLGSRRSQGRLDGASYSSGRRAGATADVGHQRVGGRRPAIGS